MIYRLGRRKKLHAEINVVPYIDVMLVLLIIFMVLSPLLIQGIDVNLPRTDTTKMSIQNEPLVVSIDKNGHYFLNLGEEEIAISLDELKDKAFVIFDANVQSLRFHETNHDFERRKIPSSFCAKLRKHLKRVRCYFFQVYYHVLQLHV